MPISRLHIHGKRHFDGMRAFYINAMMRALVFSLVGIFTPVFIYRQMMLTTGSSKMALLSVAVFYLIMRVVVALITLPVSKIIEKIGFRWSVVISVIFVAIYLMFLYLADGNWRYLYLAAVAAGLNIPFYWVARHSAIAQDSKSDKIGKQVGTLSVMERAAALLGPVAGGLMIEKWGFHALYGSAFIILVGSVVPLFSMPHHVHRNGVSLKGYLHWLVDRRFFHQAVGMMGKIFDDYGWNLIWPLVIYLMGVRFGVLGGIFSFLTLLSLIVRYLSGMIFDKLHKKRGKEDEGLFAFLAIGQAASWVVRIFVGTITQVLWVDGIATIFGSSYRNVSDDYRYLGGKRMSEIAYAAYTELTISVGAIMMMLTMMVGVYFDIWKELLFVVTAFWVIMSTVQARESNLS